MHVLLVATPGSDALRMRAEAAIVAAGHVVAGHPADSDVLLVCGSPGPDLSAATDRVWDQMPHPKHRTALTSASAINATLTAAGVALSRGGSPAAVPDPAAAVRTGGEQHPASSGHPAPASEHAHAPMSDHESVSAPHPVNPADTGHHSTGDVADHTASNDEDHATMGAHDHAAMSGHDHMSMGGPGGYPLATGTDEDRDGLEMDVLHRRLGPVLPAWPAGVVVDVTLAGDIIIAASVSLVDGGAPAHSDSSDDAAMTLDRAAQMLTLTGWAAAAARTLRIRDLVIAGDLAGARSRLRPLRRWVRRSAVLRWSLRGLPVRFGVEVRGVLLTRLEQAAQLMDGNHPEPESPVDALSIPVHIVGRDLGSARLVIAGLAVSSMPAPAHGLRGGHHDDRG